MDSLTTAKPTDGNGATKPKGKGGRPKDPDKLIFHGVGMRQSDWDYLALWGPMDSTNDVPNNPTTQLAELLERIRLMSPAGPSSFGHVSTKPPKKRLPHARINKYALEAGITKEEAIIEAWKLFEETNRNSAGGDRQALRNGE